MTTAHLHAITAAALASLPVTALAQTYTITELGTLAGPSSVHALGDDGVAAGVSTAPDAHFRAVIWNGGITSIGGLPGFADHAATARDASGRVYGVSSSFTLLGGSAFAWQGGVITPLGDFEPRGCNNAGAVVGSTPTTVDGLWLDRACLFQGGALTVLPTLGGLSAEARDIDETGRVVGSSLTLANSTPHACVWVGGTPRDLGGLGGPRAQALAIAEGGLVVGYAELTAGPARAVRYLIDAAGAVLSRTDLGTLRPGASSFAYAANAAGEIVGTSDGRAFRWHDGVMTDLNDLVDPVEGWTLEIAAAVNHLGQIAGWGYHHGQPRAFILSPACPADLNGDGLVDFADYLEFLNLYDAGDLRVDFNRDGLVDFADYLEFLNFYDAGC